MSEHVCVCVCLCGACGCICDISGWLHTKDRAARAPHTDRPVPGIRAQRWQAHRPDAGQTNGQTPRYLPGFQRIDGVCVGSQSRSTVRLFLQTRWDTNLETQRTLSHTHTDGTVSSLVAVAVVAVSVECGALQQRAAQRRRQFILVGISAALSSVH